MQQLCSNVSACLPDFTFVSCRYVNSSGNDLEYWGLDYPPMTAYHSWALGAAAAHINPNWVALEKSHGYESYDHKMFMRMSVFVTDILVYFSAALAYVGCTSVFMKSQICVSCSIKEFATVQFKKFLYRCRRHRNS